MLDQNEMTRSYIQHGQISFRFMMHGVMHHEVEKDEEGHKRDDSQDAAGLVSILK